MAQIKPDPRPEAERFHREVEAAGAEWFLREELGSWRRLAEKLQFENTDLRRVLANAEQMLEEARHDRDMWHQELRVWRRTGGA